MGGVGTWPDHALRGAKVSPEGSAAVTWSSVKAAWQMRHPKPPATTAGTHWSHRAMWLQVTMRVLRGRVRHNLRFTGVEPSHIIGRGCETVSGTSCTQQQQGGKDSGAWFRATIPTHWLSCACGLPSPPHPPLTDNLTCNPCHTHTLTTLHAIPATHTLTTKHAVPATHTP